VNFGVNAKISPMNMNKNLNSITALTAWVKVLLVATSLWAGTAMAQWTWLDKDGRKVYSDKAPPAEILDKNIIKRPGGQIGAANTAADAAANAKARVITDGVAADQAIAAASGASAPQAAASAPKLSSVDKELEKKKKEKEDAEAAKRKEEEQRVTKAKIETCARAKTAKTTLDSGVRIGITNAKGEREVMEDAARAAEVKRVQGIIDSSCR
jgi:hypothetical protein